jgi:hypothetical protein
VFLGVMPVPDIGGKKNNFRFDVPMANVDMQQSIFVVI